MTSELPIFPFRDICDFVIVDYFPLLDLDKTTTIVYFCNSPPNAYPHCNQPTAIHSFLLSPRLLNTTALPPSSPLGDARNLS